jgi:hypothetical protein
MSSSALGDRSRMFGLWLIVGVITFGRALPVAAQDFQMFVGAGVGAQLSCQSGGDPTDLNYELEGTVGALWTIPRTALAAGVQADLCENDGIPDARLGPRVEFRMPQIRRLQPFAWIGFFANNQGNFIQRGERAVVGGGADIVRAHGVDIRLSVQDAFAKRLWRFPDGRFACNPCTVPIRPTPWFRHEVSVHVAAIWK